MKVSHQKYSERSQPSHLASREMTPDWGVESPSWLLAFLPPSPISNSHPIFKTTPIPPCAIARCQFHFLSSLIRSAPRWITCSLSLRIWVSLLALQFQGRDFQILTFLVVQFFWQVSLWKVVPAFSLIGEAVFVANIHVMAHLFSFFPQSMTRFILPLPKSAPVIKYFLCPWLQPHRPFS